jgi:C-terminal processing protease CtpA/Prc
MKLCFRLVHWVFSAICVAWFVPFAGVLAQPGRAQNLGALTEEQAKFDVRVATRALTELHPALTKYNSPAEMDAAFARFETRGNAARTAADMYLAATELAAAIRCGHTWTNTLNQNGAMKTALLEAPNKLPFQLVPVESRWLVIASATDSIGKGDEVLAVNDVRAADMVKMMMPYLRADGSSDGKRLIQLSHDRNATSMMDLVWPIISPPLNANYRIEVRRKDGRIDRVEVAATTLAARKTALEKQGVTEKSETWSLTIANDVAVLRLPTFSFWRSKFDWSKWLDESFAKLSAENAKHLIVDIRDNEGGDGAINRALLSHLLKREFTWPETQAVSSYERAPYALAKYLETWDYGFFDRTGNVEKLGERRYLVKSKSQVNRAITPKEKVFAGKAYLLVGAENSSATFQLAYLAKLSGAATLVGQRTGGNLRGLNGGEIAWVTLPNSGVAIDIPLIASNPIEVQADASVEPDVLVARTFAARSASRDLEMDAVGELIASQAR